MPEETKNAAVSGEWKLVPMAQLKKWHRDLDACQKVMWLRGGFDPAYCLDAQDCLKEMEGVLATALPPYGPAPKVHRYSVVKMLSEDGNKIDYKPHGPSVVMADVHDAHVTRLQAENSALQQRLNVADQRVDELEDAAVVAKMRIRELDLTFGRYLLGMKSAVIADESGGNGMEWIFNGLAGPGELPPEDEHDAQAYFDREVEGIDTGLSEVFAFHDARRKASQVKP